MTPASLRSLSVLSAMAKVGFPSHPTMCEGIHACTVYEGEGLTFIKHSLPPAWPPVYLRKLSDDEQPLRLRLLAGPSEKALSFVLKENDSGEVNVSTQFSFISWLSPGRAGGLQLQEASEEEQGCRTSPAKPLQKCVSLMAKVKASWPLMSRSRAHSKRPGTTVLVLCSFLLWKVLTRYRSPSDGDPV